MRDKAVRIAGVYIVWNDARGNIVKRGFEHAPFKTIGLVREVCGGGAPVKANRTFDLHVGYDFKTEWFGSDRIGLTVINIADTDPPFYWVRQGTITGLAAGPRG